MGTQDIVGQFLSSIADNPDQLKQFGVDPEKTIKDATGVDLTEDEMKDVIAAVEPLIEGKGLNMDAVMKCAGDFLGSNSDNILGALGNLFGGGNESDDGKKDSKEEESGSNPINLIGELAEGLFGGK